MSKNIKSIKEQKLNEKQDPTKELFYHLATAADFIINTLCFVMIVYVLYRYNFTDGYATELLNNKTSFSNEIFKWIALSIGSNYIHSLCKKYLINDPQKNESFSN